MSYITHLRLLDESRILVAASQEMMQPFKMSLDDDDNDVVASTMYSSSIGVWKYEAPKGGESNDRSVSIIMIAYTS